MQLSSLQVNHCLPYLASSTSVLMTPYLEDELVNSLLATMETCTSLEEKSVHSWIVLDIHLYLSLMGFLISSSSASSEARTKLVKLGITLYSLAADFYLVTESQHLSLGFLPEVLGQLVPLPGGVA